MILGEEIWIDHLRTEEEYDEFFKKIRKKIKDTARKIQPLKILKPKSKGSPIGLVGRLVRPKSPSRTNQTTLSNAVVPQKAVQADSLRMKTVEEARKELLKDIEEHNEQKNQDARSLEVKEASLIQAQMDADYGNNKQIVVAGGIAVVFLIGLVAVIVYVKSRNHKNQLEALKLQVARQSAITK